MKKSLNLLTICLISIITSFCLIINCHAEACTNGKSCKKGDYTFAVPDYSSAATKQTKTAYKKEVKTYNIELDAGTKTYDDLTYYMHYFNDSGFKAIYCLDANLKSKAELYANRPFFVDYTLTKEIPYKAADYALMYILKYAPDPSSSTDFNTYFSKSLALRAMASLFNYLIEANDSDYGIIQTKSFYSMAYLWIKDENGKCRDGNCIDSSFLSKAETRTISSLKEKSDNGKYSWKSADSTIENAKKYFIDALYATVKFVKASENKIEVVATPGTIDELPEVKDENGILVSKNVNYNLNLKNFKSNSGNEKPLFRIDSVKFEKDYIELGALNDPTIISIKIKDGDYICDDEKGTKCESFLKKNLMEYIPEITDDINLELVINFKGYRSSTNGFRTLKCSEQPMKYNINYSINNEIAGEFRNNLGIVWRNQAVDTQAELNDYQRFISIHDYEPEETSGVIKDKIALIPDCSCESLKENCHNLETDAACQELKNNPACACVYLDTVCEIKGEGSSECSSAHKSYDDLCVGCDSIKIGNDACCSASNTLILGSDPEDYADPYSIYGLESGNIKACFVAKIDQQVAATDDGNGNTTNSGVPGVTDQKGNTFKLTQNRYCTISCKENYELSLPTAKLVSAGRSFTFTARINGNKSCYTNTINKPQYEKDIEQAQKDMVAAYNEWKKYTLADANGKREYRQGYCDSDCADRSYDNWYMNYNAGNNGYTYSDGVLNFGYNLGVVSYNFGESDYAVCTTVCPTNPPSTAKPCNPCDTYYCAGKCKDGSEREINDALRAAITNAWGELVAAQARYKDYIKQYQDCTGSWAGKEIKYDTEVTYDYAEETYMDLLNPRIGKMDSSVSITGGGEYYYLYNVDSSYSNNGSLGSNPLEDKYYAYCDENGCKKELKKISKAIYKKTISNVDAFYKPASVFYNNYPDGTISTSDNGNSTLLENSLPVKRNTTGARKYSLSVTNLGEFYDSKNLGRYFGSSSVFDMKELLYDCSYLVNIAKEVIENKVLVCDFTPGCTDNCLSNCIGPNCGEDICDGVNCINKCVGLGCLYDDESGRTFIDKIVSLNNLFPNGTNSYNWTNSKGVLTKNIIENTNATAQNIEGITDGTQFEGDGANNIYNTTPVLSVTINPEAKRIIDKYNKEADKNGGYNNKTLSCKAINGYERIACYSEFITSLLEGSLEIGNTKYEIDIVNSNSLIANKEYRKVGDNNTEYFTIWPGLIEDDKMLGPSWR